MRESFQTSQGYLPGVAWLYDGRQIHLAAIKGYDPERELLQAQIDSALADGFHIADVWTYWADQGGNHQLSQRTRPETIEAESVQAALDKVLSAMRVRATVQ